jgi:LysM repeat protein
MRLNDLFENNNKNRGYEPGFASPHAPSLGGRRQNDEPDGVNNIEVSINGRVWKIFAGAGPDSSPEFFRQKQKVADMCRRKTQETGKEWTWGVTGAPATNEGRMVKGPGGVPLDRQGRPVPPKAKPLSMRKWLVVHDGSHGEGGKDIIEAPNAETAWELANEYDLYIIDIKPYRGPAKPTLVDEGLNEFAPSGDNDGDHGPDEEEVLHRLASIWWLGNEQQMARAERALASMGWEIGEDEGYDDGGVFVVRAGDVNGKSYISWPHEDLQLNEATPTSPVNLNDPQYQPVASPTPDYGARTFPVTGNDITGQGLLPKLNFEPKSLSSNANTSPPVDADHFPANRIGDAFKIVQDIEQDRQNQLAAQRKDPAKAAQMKRDYQDSIVNPEFLNDLTPGDDSVSSQTVPPVTNPQYAKDMPPPRTGQAGLGVKAPREYVSVDTEKPVQPPIQGLRPTSKTRLGQFDPKTDISPEENNEIDRQIKQQSDSNNMKWDPKANRLVVDPATGKVNQISAEPESNYVYKQPAKVNKTEPADNVAPSTKAPARGSWQELAQLNKDTIPNPNRIFPGQRIKITPYGDEHIVKPGETLSSIANIYKNIDVPRRLKESATQSDLYQILRNAGLKNTP